MGSNDSLLIGSRCRLFKRDLTEMPEFISHGPDDIEVIYDHYETSCSLISLDKEGTIVHVISSPNLIERVLVKLDDGKVEKFRITEIELIG